MIPDHARMLENLNRTARTAGHDTILETWKLKRLLAAAELAEAVMHHNRLIDSRTSEGISEAAVACDKAEAAYRAARESEIR